MHKDVCFKIVQDSSILRKKHPELRKGQSVFIAAQKIDPAKAEALTGSIIDCFYQDENIDLFINKFAED